MTWLAAREWMAGNAALHGASTNFPQAVASIPSSARQSCGQYTADESLWQLSRDGGQHQPESVAGGAGIRTHIQKKAEAWDIRSRSGNQDKVGAEPIAQSSF
jgi:hypothetical protein